ncbi:MAG: DinB family protein [Bacteroidota bacterium]
MGRISTNHKQLGALLSSVTEEAHKLFDNIQDESFYKRPGQDKWCAGECLDHLNITAGLYLNEIERSINKENNPPKTAEDYKPRFILDKFIKMTGPNSKTKLKSPGVLVRKNLHEFKLPKRIVIDQFFDIQKRLQGFLKQSENISLSKAMISWPVLKFIKLQLGEAFLLNGVHALRHLQQAERAINSLSNK